MKIVKRDWIFVAIIVLVLGALFANTLKAKQKNVPNDENHRLFYEIMRKSGDRKEVEKGCLSCHNSKNTPLPKAHPPKEQCLICHKLFQNSI